MGVALVATGGLGRRECAPYGDVDLLLLHRGAGGDRDRRPDLVPDLGRAASALDHSVRTVPEALSVAIDDVRVALSLLDARFVAGDPRLAAELRSAAARPVAAYGRARAGPAAEAAVDARSRAHGDLAFLLEGDLKESARRSARRADPARRSARSASPTRTGRRSGPPTGACSTYATRCTPSAGRRVDRVLRAGPRRWSPSSWTCATAMRCCAGCPPTRGRSRTPLDDAWRAVDRWRDRGPIQPTGRTPVARDVVA